MATVFDILWGVGPKLPGVWFTGVADGGGADYIADAEIGGSDDVWNGGTLLIKDNSESGIIADYDAKGNVNGDGYVQVQSNLGTAAAGTERYGLIKKRYRRELLLQLMNEAMTDEIRLPELDDTSLDTASNTKKYDLPTGVTDDNLLQVWIARRTAAPYEWERIYRYRVVQDGGTHSLIFWDQPIYTRDIRLVYWTNASALWADSDSIDARIHHELLIWMTVRKAVEWRYSRFPNPPEREQNALNAALRREREKMRAYMPRLPQPTPKIAPFDTYSPHVHMPVPEDSS